MLSDRINRLSESATIAMAQKSRELKAKGFDIISLALGEPDFNTPDFVNEAAHQAIDDNYSKYMPVPGYLDLREAIVEKFKRDNGLNYEVSQVMVSTGAKQCIANAVLSTVNPGDDVLLPAPFWVTYEEIVKLAGGNPIIIETDIEDDFKLTPQLLASNITSNTKMMIFSSPCNPTGSLYSKNELTALAEVIAQHKHMYVISDEIYEHINFVGEHQSLASNEAVYNQVITINGVSKAYAMTGWRIGYLAAPKEVTEACIKMQGQFTSGASSIAQRAALAAIKADPQVTHEMRDTFKKRRDFMLAELGKIEGFKLNEPEGAFYIFPEISSLIGKSCGEYKINSASDLCMYFLEDAHVAVVTGEAFGAPNYFRISYAASDAELAEAVKRLQEAVKKLS